MSYKTNKDSLESIDVREVRYDEAHIECAKSIPSEMQRIEKLTEQRCYSYKNFRRRSKYLCNIISASMGVKNLNNADWIHERRDVPLIKK